jgi:tRNA threonylcarbamoyladenosine biosynthesis protein TsaB
MYVIGIDTTTKAFCLALVQDGETLERLIIDEGGYHSEDFIAHLEDVLRRRGLYKGDIDGYSISIGPGSLTGVRVGLSFCKGLGYATGKPVVGVATLYAIAYGARDGAACVCPVLVTRRDRLFWALFRFSPEEHIVVEASCTKIDGLLKVMPRREILFLGNGALACKSLIEQQMGSLAQFGEKMISHPDPAVVAMLGLGRIRKGDVPALDELEPIYL